MKSLGEYKSNIAKFIAAIIFYIAMILILQAIAPIGSNLGAMKRQIAGSGVIFALGMTLWGFSRRGIIAFGALLVIYLSVPLLEILVGMKVNGTEILITASLATILFSVLSSLVYFLNFIPHRFRLIPRILVAFVAFPAILYPFLLWGYWGLNGKFLTVEDILAVFQTNFEEAVSYLQEFGMAVPFLLAIVVLVVLFISYKITSPLQTRVPVRAAMGIIIIITSFCIGLSCISHTSNCVIGKLTVLSYQKLQVYSLYASKARERKSNLASMNISIDQKEPGIYLLIIGESATRDHMSVYGYPHETTPYFNTLSNQPGAIIFNNAYSNYVLTIQSLTYALTEKNQYNSLKIEDAYSLIEVAKAAGYKTYWLSNQNPWVAADTPLTSIALSADKQAFVSKFKKGRQLTYDDCLVKAMPDLSEDTHALVIVHLRGAHNKYIERYPKEWKMKTGEDELVNEYDSAIYYNDEVLRRLTEKVSKYKHFKGWIYFSDHGEEPDQHLFHTPSKFTWQMTRIPFAMQFTPSYIEENPQIYENLAHHRDCYWTNDLLYDFMISVLGIKGAPMNESNLNLASSTYDRTRSNVLTLHGEKYISEEPVR